MGSKTITNANTTAFIVDTQGLGVIKTIRDNVAKPAGYDIYQSTKVYLIPNKGVTLG